MASKKPEAIVLNAGRDGKLMRDYLIKNKISIGWSVGDPSDDRYRDFRQYSASEVREDNPSGYPQMPVVKFLGLHENEDKNIHIGDDVIVYASNDTGVLVGVFTVSGEAEYDPNPIQLTDEKHYYYRNVVPKPWSKPVVYDEFKEHYFGDKQIPNPSTLQPFYGDLSKVREAVQSAPRAEIEPKNVTYQRH